MFIKQAMFDGSFLSKKFAYNNFKEKTLLSGNIIASNCPVKLPSENFNIEEGLNFFMEIPNNNLVFGLTFTRLISSYLGTILSQLVNENIDIEGNTLFINKEYKKNGIILKRGQLNIVKINYVKDTFLAYIGFCIKGGEKSLSQIYDLSLDDKQKNDFYKQVIETFYNLTTEIFLDVSKYGCT